jgi:hypothetical protein
VVLVLSFAILGVGCGAGYASTDPDTPEEEPDPTVGWPKDAPGLLAHLNTWDKSRLESYERPDLDLQKHLEAQSGETGDWVRLHEEKLEKLGVKVKWNPEAKVYEKQ